MSDRASEALIRELGYDPRPELRRWHGTPIPEVRDPLKATAARVAIAERVWWHGPAWTVLRNASTYLWHVMDYAEDDDIDFTRRDVPRTLWVRALEEARPGLLSSGSYALWSSVYGLMADDELCSWPQTAHRKDLRPMARETRERMYARMRYRRRYTDNPVD